MRDGLAILPQSDAVDATLLKRALDSTTQCYKFLFFRSLLTRVASSDERSIALVDILADMIEFAWWPVMHYRLNIGVGQGVHQMRALVGSKHQDLDERLGPIDVRAHARRLAGERINAEMQTGVLRYVRFRILSPWFEDVPGHEIDARIVKASKEEIERRNAPYFFVGRDGIEVAEPWADYFKRNFPIVKGWADLRWLDWVQARNPSVSVGLEKLGPPSQRQSLAAQTAFLKLALGGVERPLCIFTGEPLEPMRIALDHFLPRSYVGHDRIWNLVPVAPANNSRKGARLPHREAVGRLAEFHFTAIETASNGHAPNWRKYWEEYSSDLRVDPERLLEPGVLADAYIGTVCPMLDIAKRMGFPEGWP
jgi:hypothetical protein